MQSGEGAGLATGASIRDAAGHSWARAVDRVGAMAAAGFEDLPFVSAGTAELNLLATKLARPQVPTTYVRRPHIDRMLNEGARGSLTVVSAGAGWGKTLTTAAWAASVPAVAPVAWLSLDESDNHPRSFWSYLVAALRNVVRVPRGNPLAELAPGLGSQEENVGRLVAGLARLPTPVVVVLDDFQVVHEPAVLSRVSELLRHPPPQLRLVLLTRADPALHLHRLRITGELAEIRSEDLAFSAAEAVSLLAADGVTVDTDAARLLVDRTEGWPAGLRLASFFLRGQGPGRTPADFAGDDQAVADYLAEEVFASQPPELRRFLVRTSVAERVSSELARVLTDEARGQLFLETLERSNAFVIGLGSDRQWYRYHPLLREMLHHQLTIDEPQILPDLHRRAAQWFAASGYPIEALRHAAEAADWQLLGHLFVTQAAPLLVSAERTALDAELARIPAQLVFDGPELATCAAARLLHVGRFQEMRSHLERAEAQLQRTRPESRTGTYIAIRLLSTAVARTNGDLGGLIAAASEAIDELSGPGLALPAVDQYRAVALSNLGTGLLWTGDLEQAEERLLEGLEVTTATGLEVSRINALAHLALVAAVSGRLRQAFVYGSEAVELVEARGWAPLAQAATAYLALAMVHLQWNNVDEAPNLLGDGATAASLDLAPRYAIGLTHARLDASLGNVAAARERLAQLRHDFGRWQAPAFLARWLAVTEDEADLAAGDPGAVLARFAERDDLPTRCAREQVGLARALLAHGDSHQAEQVLAPLRDGTAATPAAVEIWLLTALVADRLGADSRATEALGHALEAAKPERVRRPFLVLGTERLAPLLTRLGQLDHGLSGFVDELIADLNLGRSQGEAGPPSEPLTDRELTVLRYLPTMMTNAEIASELYVSVNTVKAHLKRIYRKLGVVSRRQAVHRARALGLLTE